MSVPVRAPLNTDCRKIRRCYLVDGTVEHHAAAHHVKTEDRNLRCSAGAVRIGTLGLDHRDQRLRAEPRAQQPFDPLAVPERLDTFFHGIRRLPS